MTTTLTADITSWTVEITRDSDGAIIRSWAGAALAFYLTVDLTKLPPGRFNLPILMQERRRPVAELEITGSLPPPVEFVRRLLLTPARRAAGLYSFRATL